MYSVAISVVLSGLLLGADEPRVKLTFPNGAVGGWSPAPMKLKGAFFADRPYAWLKMPKDFSGATLLVRGAGDSAKWLAPKKVHVSRACTAFAIVRVKYNEKSDASDEVLRGLEEAGWERVPTAPDSTAPKGEVWKWGAYRIKIPAGEVMLPAPKKAWTSTVVYAFK